MTLEKSVFSLDEVHIRASLEQGHKNPQNSIGFGSRTFAILKELFRFE